MRITNVTTQLVTKQNDSPLWNPRITWSEKTSLLIYIETDSDLVGIGEGWCDGSSPSSTIALIDQDLKPLLIGEDPFCSARIWDRIFQKTIYSVKDGIIFAALSAIDIAIWDLVGKATKQPVYRLLGGFSDKVFAYASGGLYGKNKGPQEVATEMAGYVQKGFRGVKLKIGGASLREDVARVAVTREAIGPDIRLMVDALYALSVSDAIRMGRALERYDVYFLEAPVLPHDVKGLVRVNTESPVPVAGNEFAYGRFQFRELIDRSAVSFVHLDAILCGGISESLKIAAIAAAAHIPCSFHAASSAVCFAANLHAAAAIANCDSIEYHMVHQLLFDALPIDTFRVENGYVKLPTAPGLGIDVWRGQRIQAGSVDGVDVPSGGGSGAALRTQ